MFINLSNHPISRWQPAQIEAARKYGELKEMAFPSVPAEASSDEIDRLAGDYLDKIMVFPNPVVMVQGEFTFTYKLVNKLKAAGIKVVAACSRRSAVEKLLKDGTYMKESVFVFSRFREY